MDKCPYCNCNAVEKTGEIKTKDETDYKIVVIKTKPQYIKKTINMDHK